MNPYQIAGVVAGCLVAFAGIVTLLAMQGMPLLLAFLSVYAIAFVTMVGMQRRARQSCEGEDEIDAFDDDRSRFELPARCIVEGRTADASSAVTGGAPGMGSLATMPAAMAGVRPRY